MSRKRKFAVAAATFGVALSIGFIMQNGDALASRMSLDGQTPISAPEMADVVTASTITIPALTQDQAQEAQPMIEMISLVDPETSVADAVVADACDVSMTASALPMAMVALSVQAPCFASEYVTFHHQGMMFKDIMDAEGQIDLIVPALAENAFFLLSFDNGTGSASSVEVSDFAAYDRAVLQWQGINAVQLHALEFGADYGSDGHVWSAAARELDFVSPPKDGFLVALGDPTADQPLLVEIYTYPTGAALADGTVALSVEAEVTADNCGREVTAQSLQFGPDYTADALDLTMTMPDCDAIGQFLVLKNMFKDLTLAAK